MILCPTNALLTRRRRDTHVKIGGGRFNVVTRYVREPVARLRVLQRRWAYDMLRPVQIRIGQESVGNAPEMSYWKAVLGSFSEPWI